MRSRKHIQSPDSERAAQSGHFDIFLSKFANGIKSWKFWIRFLIFGLVIQYIYISFTFCVRIFLRWILAHSLSKSYRWGKWCPWKVWYMSAFTHETIREILKQFWGGSKNQRFVTPYTGFGWNCVTIRSIIQMIYIYIICAWRG